MKLDYEVYDMVIQTGTKKTQKKEIETLAAGVLGGAFIALGSIGYLMAASSIEPVAVGKLVGAMLFPVGLLLVLLTGAELFTGNNLMSLSVMHGEASANKVLFNWVKIFLYNAIGAIMIAALVHGGKYDLGSFFELLEKMVYSKTSLDFSTAFARGVLCNLLVAIAVWISFASGTAGGKAVLIWMPIALFVYSGYEHSVANMLYFSLAYLAGINVTMSEILGNMIPVTLGNVVGGGVVLPVLYFGAFKDRVKRK